jgi:hypothetical protein
MILLQSSLPCSENFFRYKKNYEKFVSQGPKSSEGSPKNLTVPIQNPPPTKKVIASPKIMSKLSPIQTMFRGNNLQQSSLLQKYSGVQPVA